MQQRKPTRREKIEARKNSPAQVASAKQKQHSRSFAVHALLISMAAFLLYSNTLKNDFALDDNSAIKKNWVVKQGTKGFGTILTTSYRFGYRQSDDELYRPLPLMVFAALWQLFPGNPYPFHLLNVLLYALTAFVLYNLLKKIFSGINPLLPFLAALIFIFHPLHTEVVANIKSLDEILSFLFVLFSINQIYIYIEKNRTKNLVFAWIFFFLAFMSKEGTIVMLLVVPLLLSLFSKATKNKIVLVTLVLSSAAALFIFIRANALGGFAAGKHFQVQENVLVSAPNAGIRLATIFYVLLQYLKLMVVPYPLSSDYSFRQIELASWSQPLPWLSLVIYLGMATIAVRQFRKNKIVSFSILFFLAAISLYSNLLMTIGSLFAERFLYAPLLGFAILISWVMMKIVKLPLAEGIKKSGDEIFQKGNQNVLLAVSLLLIPYSWITVARNSDWKDTLTLFSRDVKNAPQSALLHFNYGNELKAEKAAKETDANTKRTILDTAIYHYKQALLIYPGYTEVYEQLGLAYYYQDKNDSALFYINKAIEAEPLKSTAYNSLGTLYFEKAKDYKKALELYLHAVELNPNYIDGWRNTGCTYGTLGQYDKAIEAFQHALRLDPVNVPVLNFTAQTYRSMGDEASANAYSLKAQQAERKQ